MIVRKNKMN